MPHWLCTFVVGLACAGAASAADPQRIEANLNVRASGSLAAGEQRIRLVIDNGLWFPEAETGPSAMVQAFGEEGGPLQVPGPMIRVAEGSRLHINITNKLVVAVKIYGLHEHPGDAKKFLEVPAGETQEVSFAAGEPGTYLYWATTSNKKIDERDGADETLGGAFVVDLNGSPVSDTVFVIQHLNVKLDPPAHRAAGDGEIWAINGKMWPYGNLVNTRQDDTLRWRWVNASYEPHPLHLHGTYFHVLSTNDGEHEQTAPAGQQMATFPLTEGESLTLEWKPERPGNWLFHCHLVFHTMPYLGIFAKDSKSTDRPIGRDAHQHMSGLVVGVKVAQTKRPSPHSYAQARRLDLYLKERGFNYPPPKDVPLDLPALGFELREKGRSSGALSPSGPVIVLERGKPVEIAVHNELKEATSIHWHGIELESYYDGVAGWGGNDTHIAPEIQPGGTFIARFIPPRAGTFIYHAHMQDYYQVANGLNGALIVMEPGKKRDPEMDRVILLGRDGWDDEAPSLLNGSREPQAWQMVVGKRYRLRLININPANRRRIRIERDGKPEQWRSIAKDGADLQMNLVLEGPAEVRTSVGETYDFEFTPRESGSLKLSVWNWDGSKELNHLQIAVAAPRP